MTAIEIKLPEGIKAALSDFATVREWPAIMTPEKVASLILARQLYDLGIIDSAQEGCRLAECRRVAWLAMGLSARDVAEQADDIMDNWLESLGEGADLPPQNNRKPPQL